ncbi:MAG: DUF4149 domain-containing protein [Verrucomicrobia subdivision 3 bacterium]|nr:DUF4149 domain-containing protein [Limisphaerales bacterium]
MNAAVWFGAAIFFTIAVAPVVLTTPLLKQYVGEAWLGIVAQMILERYFILQLCCCIVAIVHQMAEWLYLGKPLHQWTMAVLSGLFVIAVADSAWLEPRLNLLHEIKYGYRRGGSSTPQQKFEAAKVFRRYHGLSQTMNLLALCGVGVLVWRVSTSNNTPRFVPANKFRS